AHARELAHAQANGWPLAVAFEARVPLGRERARWPDLDAVAAGVGDDAAARVEAHGLGIEQRGRERRWVVVLEITGGVDDEGEGRRVRLGKTVVGERAQLLVD